MAGIYNQLFCQCDGVKVSLSDICTIRKGQQVNGEDLCSSNEDGNLYYVMNGGTEPSGYYDSFNSDTNTISISEGGNSCGYVQWNSKKFWAGGHCYTLYSIQNTIDAKYLYHYLKFKEKSIMDLRVGSGLPNIQKKDLERFQILMPKYKDQITLVKVFESINKKIDIEAQLLDSYSIEKSFLLSQMFI